MVAEYGVSPPVQFQLSSAIVSARIERCRSPIADIASVWGGEEPGSVGERGPTRHGSVEWFAKTVDFEDGIDILEEDSLGAVSPFQKLLDFSGRCSDHVVETVDSIVDSRTQ